MAVLAFEKKGQFHEAVSELERFSGNAADRGHLAHGYVKVGRLAEARTILSDLQSRVRIDSVGAYEVAFIHAALGDRNEAFKWLDIAYQQHDSGLTYLRTDPTLDPLRSDPRFQDLLRRVGLSP